MFAVGSGHIETKSRQVKVVGATCRYVHVILEADDLYQLQAHYKVADLYHMHVHRLDYLPSLHCHLAKPHQRKDLQKRPHTITSHTNVRGL